jgi:IS1 family transposase
VTRSKPHWIVCALQKDIGQVIDFAVGKRNNSTLSRTINTLLTAKAQTIYTDKLPNYFTLIPKEKKNFICSEKIFPIDFYIAKLTP